MEHTAPIPATSSPARPVSVTLGIVAIVCGLAVSGYAAMGFAVVGGAFGMTSRRRTLPLVLNGLGFALGFTAQLMKAALDRGWIG